MGYIQETASSLAAHGKAMMETWGLRMDSECAAIYFSSGGRLSQPVCVLYGFGSFFVRKQQLLSYRR